MSENIKVGSIWGRIRGHKNSIDTNDMYGQEGDLPLPLLKAVIPLSVCTYMHSCSPSPCQCMTILILKGTLEIFGINLK